MTTERTQPTESRRRRRNLTVVAVFLAAAALALWGASRMNWATLTAADGLAPPREFTVKGADWSPWLTPLAIALVAAIAAAVALRGWLLRIVSVIIAAIGILSVIPAISMLTGDKDTAYAAKAIDLPGRYQVLSIATHSAAVAVVVLGGVCAVIAGVLLLRVTRGAPGMSSKYTSPAARRAELEERVFAEREQAARATAKEARADDAGIATGKDDAGDAGSAAREDSGPTERMLWDAMDTGADPTQTGDAVSAEHRDRDEDHNR